MVTVAVAAVAVVVVHVVHSAGGILLAAGILLVGESLLAAEILLAAAVILLAAAEILLAETVESEVESLVGKILLGFDQTEAVVVVVGRTVPVPGTAVVVPVLAAPGRTVESVDH